MGAGDKDRGRPVLQPDERWFLEAGAELTGDELVTVEDFLTQASFLPAHLEERMARAAAGLSTIDSIPGEHFPQEDQARAVAERFANFTIRS